MIIVTGGAGFIGSALVWKLNQMGEENILIVDELGTGEKWKNLSGLRYTDYMEKEFFLDSVLDGKFSKTDISAILHMGACSSTTEKDADYLVENNYQYSKELAEYALTHKIRFIYASSAATYGAGENGYKDDESGLHHLRPLNMYGYSKQMFDTWALKKGYLNKIAGMKYFNVFGPNEYHKGDMRSMVLKAFEQIRGNGTVRLFKSSHPDYKDGEQVRDFIYVKDAVDMTLFFLENRDANGIFNIGTAQTTTWKQMMTDLFEAVGQKPNIVYIDMPEALKDHYQYHTQADISKLRAAGYSADLTPMKEAILDYAEYLKNHSYLSAS